MAEKKISKQFKYGGFYVRLGELLFDLVLYILALAPISFFFKLYPYSEQYLVSAVQSQMENVGLSDSERDVL